MIEYKKVMREVQERVFRCDRCRRAHEERALQKLIHYYTVEDHGRERDYDREVHLCGFCVNELVDIWQRRAHEAAQPEKEYL